MRKKLTILSLALLSFCFSTQSLAQNLSHKCTYTDSLGIVLDMSTDGYAAISSEKTLRIVKVNNVCQGEVMYTQTFPENISSAYIQSKGDSVVFVVMTEHIVHFRGLRKDGNILDVATTGEEKLTTETYDEIKVSKTTWGMSILMHYTTPAATARNIAYIRYNTAGSFSSYATTCNCYVGIVSDDTTHYLIYTDPTGVYIEKRRNDVIMSYVDRYFIINTANTAVTDYLISDTSITVMALDKGTGKTIRQIVDRTSPVLVGYYSPYTFIPNGMGKNNPTYVNRGVTMYDELIVKHGENISGAIGFISDLAFGGSSTGKFLATPLDTNYFLWSGLDNGGSGPLVINLMSSVPKKEESIVINEVIMSRTGSFYTNNSYYAFGSGNGKAKVWIVDISIPAVEVSNVYTPQSAGVSIYPNPAGNFVNIISNDPISAIRLLDMRGKYVRMFRGYQNNEQLVSLDNELAAGTYIVEILTNNGSISRQKLIKL